MFLKSFAIIEANNEGNEQENGGIMMDLKKWLKVGLVGMTSLTLAACGNGGDKSSDSGDKGSDLDIEAELAKEPTGEKLVLISNNGSNGRSEYVLGKLKEKGFNVEFVELGGGDVTARVISETANPTTNVVWGPTQFNFDDMIAADALLEWKPTWADQVSDFDRQNGISYPYETQPKLWLTNPDEFSEDELPKTVNDLFEDEKFHGKYTIPSDFGGTTNRAIVSSILGQYLDESGELGVSEDGWKAMKAFLDNGVKTPEGEDKYKNMMDGKTPITYDGASNIITNISDLDKKPTIIYFDNGQPSNVNEIGVVKNSNKEVLAESLRLADYLGSAEFIGDFSAKFGNIITNKDAQDKRPELSQEIGNNFKEQDLDWDTINKHLDDWVAKIELEMM